MRTRIVVIFGLLVVLVAGGFAIDEQWYNWLPDAAGEDGASADACAKSRRRKPNPPKPNRLT